jgi:hypothetical protein
MASLLEREQVIDFEFGVSDRARWGASGAL